MITIRTAVLPSGAKANVHLNPLVTVVEDFDRSKTDCHKLKQGIEDYSQAREDQRYLAITILNDWRMFVTWGTPGGDCCELPVIELRDEAHTVAAIISRLEEALASLR
jgi:hypothetical protein